MIKEDNGNDRRKVLNRWLDRSNYKPKYAKSGKEIGKKQIDSKLKKKSLHKWSRQGGE